MHRLTIISGRLAIAIVVAMGASIGVGYAASLGLGSNQLHAWRQTLTKGTCNQTSATADDTYVQQALPTSTAGGTATTLTISPTALAQDHAFIRFDLSGCSLPTTAGADTATLTVFVTTNGNDTISLFPVYSSWSSSTLTWNGVSGLTIGSTATTSFSARRSPGWRATALWPSGSRNHEPHPFAFQQSVLRGGSRDRRLATGPFQLLLRSPACPASTTFSGPRQLFLPCNDNYS